MIKNKRIGFIGAGNMGEALIRGLLESKAAHRAMVAAYDTNQSRCKYIASKYKIKQAESNMSLVRQSDIVIIAVKPQDMESALREICWDITSGKLIISAAAGIATSYIENKLKKGIPVIRSMPNTPAFIRAGVTGICKGRYATQKDMNIAKAVFSAVGDVVTVKENLMNAVTAISGSGPGYYMYIIEAFIVASMEMGLTWNTALKLVSGTALGSARLLVEGKMSPSELREQVTSKGGTTEAALKLFQKKKLSQIIVDGALAAEKRGKQLSRSK